eukprot:TRINITY_DN9858_c0_g3_i1.p1 TRINITY_DN9858_c0_g3~~TRINITY_DN9858_c0_g3_i1.p1  ORF type:complete len:137 (+),score=45.71 TRINITY_DN9858_c0_g3_i1:940-1350(+)
MRDKYDIRKIIEGRYFKAYRAKCLRKNLIASENYMSFEFKKKEVERVIRELKLTKSRVYQCLLMIKFALLDESDKKAVELFKEEMKKRKKLLMHDFEQDDDKATPRRQLKSPYISLTLKVRSVSYTHLTLPTTPYV